MNYNCITKYYKFCFIALKFKHFDKAAKILNRETKLEYYLNLKLPKEKPSLNVKLSV